MKQHKRLLMTIALVLASGSSQAAHADDWVGSWSAAMIRSPASANALLDVPQAAMPLADQTLRQMVLLSAGGRRLRIRLANTFGSRALTLQAISVGVRAPAGRGNLIPPSLHALRFDGAPSVTIPAGASSGKRIRLRGQGIHKSETQQGDLYAELQIVLPKQLDEQSRELIRQLQERLPDNPRAELRW